MKRLYRSETDKKIAGVCGGLGIYLNLDPTVIRIVFLLLLLPGGLPGLVPYLILWLLIPAESEVKAKENKPESRKIAEK
jgi:phage shock protein C